MVPGFTVTRTTDRRIVLVVEDSRGDTTAAPIYGNVYIEGVQVIRLGPGRSRYLGTALPDIAEICQRSPPPVIVLSRRDEDLQLKLSASRVALELAVEAARQRPRPPRAPRQPRHGFQQAARLPCFRGVRRR